MENEFAHFIRTDEFIFKHAKGIRDIYGKEFHTFHEIFLFLGGEAEFTSDKIKLKLLPGTLVIIPKKSFHQFTCKNDHEYRRCVFNFSAVSELDLLIDKKMSGVYTAMISPDLLSQFDELFSTAEREPEAIESKILAKALLARLLCRLDSEGNAKPPAEGFNQTVTDAVSFIDAHIREPISVLDVAQALHISESYLMRIFKRDMHISIYRYITEKRLIMAAGEIENGVPATIAAIKSGFGDYSGFYKLYKKMFGVSPSQGILRHE